MALNHIQHAQDPVGGGWRYKPKQPGDTSVTGWQLKAVKTGHMTYLTISPRTIRGVIKFLDSVSSDSGAFYGYMAPGKGPATTAIGLQCRLHLGWDYDNPAVERGVNWLVELGPALDIGKTNMYYNYFATQVLALVGGEPWTNLERVTGIIDHRACKRPNHCRRECANFTRVGMTARFHGIGPRTI